MYRSDLNTLNAIRVAVQEESMNMFISYFHDECEDTEEYEYCVYCNENTDLNIELISDRLNMPIFSIERLLNTLNIEITK